MARATREGRRVRSTWKRQATGDRGHRESGQPRRRGHVASDERDYLGGRHAGSAPVIWARWRSFKGLVGWIADHLPGRGHRRTLVRMAHATQRYNDIALKLRSVWLGATL